MSSDQCDELILPQDKDCPGGTAGTDLCLTAGFAGTVGAAGDPGRWVSRGVGGGAAHTAGMLREELGEPWDNRMAMEDWVVSRRAMVGRK